MRKKVLITLVLTTTLSSINPTAIFANEPTIVTEKQIKNAQTEALKSYLYNIDGVEIESNIPLSNNEQIGVYQQASQQKIMSYEDMGGAPGMMYGSPQYKTYTNTTEKELAEIAVAYMTARIAKVATLNQTAAFFVTYFGTKMKGWIADLFKPTYIGMWITREQKSDGYYHYYLTVVNYSNSTYKQPIKVQFNETGRSLN